MTYVFRLLTVLSMFAFAQMAWGQQIYKSVMPDGSVVYSYQPPSTSKRVEAITPEDTHLGNGTASLSPGDRESGGTGTVAQPQAVTLFSAKGCGYCARAKIYLAAHGIAYQDIDTGTPQGSAAMTAAGGGKSVPFLVWGKRHVTGFSAAKYDRFFGRK